MMRNSWQTLLIVAILGLPLAGVASAQSIDELLDLPGSGDSTPKPAPTDDKPAVAIDPEIERALADPEEVPILLQQALNDMQDASRQLHTDAGVSTQRKMEEAMLKLDRMIAEAKKQQQQQQSSSSSSSSSASQQQQSGDQQAQQQQAGSQQNAGQQNQDKPGDQQGDQSGEPKDGVTNMGNAGVNPNTRSGEAGGPIRSIEELKKEWGSLPARVREDLLEGLDERFSPLYREMTESYYQRLAEEGK